jgi:NAD(P)-dependent dehydrogenase (short-subunit alcohol dehydrogenase family)
MNSNWKEKVALVTGASSGIGRATALAFAEEGARVMVADVSTDGGEEAVRVIRSRGGEASFVKTDVSRAHDVEAMVAKTLKTYGRLDCAFNNAGIEGTMASVVDCTEANWDRIIATNLKGVWLCMKYELPKMVERKRGAIVNTSSIAGLVGFQGLCAYDASKHGIVGLTRTAALEFAKQGIRVNAVCPGAIETPMLDRLEKDQPEVQKSVLASEPVGRVGKPEEIAAAVLWLCSDAASFVTGQALAVDGGWVAQ